MKRNFLLLAFLCALLVGFGPGTVQAQSGAVSIERIDGLDGGKLDTSQALRFVMRFENTAPVRVDISNGWEIYSPDGADWDSVTVDSLPPYNFETWPFTNYFNQVLSLWSGTLYLADGTNPDTVGILGAGTPSALTRQLPIGYNDTPLAVTVWQSGDENNAGKHLCIDSAFWGVGGTWKWVGRDLLDYYPTWSAVGLTHVLGEGFCFQFEGGAPPAVTLQVSPTALTFEATEGGANPAAKQFNVALVGGGIAAYSITESIPWLSTTPTSGNTPQDVSVNIDIATLVPGTYVDSLQVISVGATNTPVWVKVTLTVNASPKTLVVTPDTLTFVVQEDGPLPVFQNFSVTELGGASISYTASEGSAWFALQNAAGTTPGTVRVDITTSNVDPGTYIDSVMFTSAEATNSPLYRYVKYVVNAAPRILVVDPVLLNFSAVEGGPNPAGQLVTVTESHDDTITFTATEDATWISLSTTDFTTPGGFTVDLDITGVTEGIYTDTVVVESGEAANSPIYVEVVLSVGPPDAQLLVLVPDTLYFTAVVGAIDVPAQWFRVNEAGGSNIAFTASETSAWITLAEESGTTPDSVLVDLDLTGVGAGMYLDSIMVTAAEADNSPVWEYVMLTVTEVTCPALVVSDTLFMTSVEVDVAVNFTDTLFITSSGPGELDWTALDIAAGFGIVPSSGMTPSGAVIINFSKTYTEVGTYTECFTIRGTQTAAPECSSFVDVCLKVTVTGGPVCADFILNDTVFQFTAIEGGPAAPAFRPFEVTLSDGGSATFMISRPLDNDWIYFIAGTDTLTQFNGMTPASGKIIVDPTGLTPGFYQDVLVLTSEASNVCEPRTRMLVVSLTVEGAPQPTADSVSLGTVSAAAGGDAGVPIYLSNECDLLAGALFLDWDNTYLFLDSVSYVGSRLNTGASVTDEVNNTAGSVALRFEANNISEVIPPGSGLWGELWFSVDPSAPVGLNVQIVLGDSLVTLTRNCGDSIELVTPVFDQGDVEVVEIEQICGYVTDEEGTEIEGATVQLWANFPYGSPLATTTTNENGAFFFDGPVPTPYDVYAFATGYYPGTLEDVISNQCGTIELRKLDDLEPSPNWVDYYCGTNTLMDSVPLPVGTVIEVRDPDGMLVGQQYVTEPGLYPFMPVYRDSLETLEDEGARTGDMLLFYINGTPAQTDPEVVIYPADYQQVQVCLNGSMAPQICTLMPGWNLVSWRVDTPTDDIENVLGPIMDCIEVVLGFEGGGLTYDPELQEFSTLWYVDHLSGYWVKVKDGCSPELVLNGVVVPANTPIPVYAGWNLVSYLPEFPMAPEMSLTSVMDKLIIAYGYDMGVKVFKPDQPNFNTLETMEPCHGYWLKLTAPDQLIYPTDLPAIASGSENPRAYAARLAAPSNVATTIAWVNLYSRNLTLDGQKVKAGAEVAAYTTSGTRIGSFRMAQDGKFGFMPVYSDAGQSEQITGLRAGEQFTIRVDGVETSETFTWTRSGDRIEVGRLTAKNTGSVPTSYSLAQNYPNPFNPSTTISFSLPASGTARLEIYNVLGELVAVPFNGSTEAGEHQVVWDGRDVSGSSVASGVYFYRLTADNFTETRKMMLLK